MQCQNNREIGIREGEILRLLVSEYIDTEQPVSSLYLTNKYNLGLSSATVRSVFVELESQGFLISPYKSSGRIPTEKAYRYYVNKLPEERKLSEETRRFIQQEYLKRNFCVEQILDVTSKILSILTNSVGIVLGPEPDKTVLKHVELIDMGQNELLMIIVTRSGIIYTRSLFLEDRIPVDMLRKVNNYLNALLKGSDLSEAKYKLEAEMNQNLELSYYYQKIFKTLLGNFDCIYGEEDIYSAGVEKLLLKFYENKKGSENIEKLFDSKCYIKKIFSETNLLDDVSIVINGDSDSMLTGLSVITANYKMGEKKIGSLGVIGPNRMNYGEAVSVVSFVGRLMSGMITKISN